MFVFLSVRVEYDLLQEDFDAFQGGYQEWIVYPILLLIVTWGIYWPKNRAKQT